MTNKEPRNTKNSLLSRWKNKSTAKQVVSSNSDVTIQPIPSDAQKPLSFEQKRLWFLQQLYPGNPFYNYAELFRLEGALEVSVIRKSIDLIIKKHEVFKSSFPVINGIPTVKILSQNQQDFEFYDYSELGFNKAQNKAKETLYNYSRTSFKLSEGNLFKSVLIKIADNNYLFLAVMHHIITDHWSMTLFREELATNYAKLVAGKPLTIEKPSIQYDSYAYWQQNRSLNKDHLEYWKQKLKGPLPILNLPTDYSKKGISTFKGALHKKQYNQKSAETFFKLCKQLEATPYVVMLSVFYILLHKYTEQEDILIGTSITKRNQKSLEKIIGFFNDTLVFRTQIKTSSTFKQVVKAVRKTTLEAFANSDVSYDSLVKQLNPERSLNLNPFFQVMFLYNSDKKIADFGSNIKITHEPFDAGVSKFDLTLHIFEKEGSLTSLIDYETDLFEKDTINRIHDHFEILLLNFIENPQKQISNTVIETKEEKEFFDGLQNTNNSTLNISAIHEIIEEQIKKKRDLPAVTFKNNSVTYQDLGEQADTIARCLIANGVKKNDIVGLSLHRSTHMIVALLGILKSGAAYLPLDPEYPKDRTNYILENSNSKFVITSDEIKHNFNTTTKATIFTLESILTGNFETKNVEFPTVNPTDLAYVIYTSGSTGKPKGVPISHGNIINSTLARTKFYESDPSAFLLLSSISFDSSKAGIFWSLCTGANLVISEDKLEQDIERLSHTIKQNKVSHTLMLPSLYQMVLDFGNKEELSSLEVVTVAGESCSKKIVTTHFNKLPNTQLINEYGPTEGTVWCIAHKITEADANKENIPIGKPVAGTEIYILDKDLNRVPFGIPGELYIGGKSLSKGYLNNPKKTNETFIKNPLKNNEVLYKTGDLVKLNNDTSIEFLGRKDQQIKIRGYRVEIDEIEQVIKSCSSVDETVVVVENSSQSIGTKKLETLSTDSLLQTINDSNIELEVEGILNTIELLNDDEISVISENSTI